MFYHARALPSMTAFMYAVSPTDLATRSVPPRLRFHIPGGSGCGRLMCHIAVPSAQLVEELPHGGRLT